MATAFAALEARVNSAVFRCLSNSVALLAGLPVTGIFTDAYQAADLGGAGFATSQPAFTLPTSSLAGDPTGLALVVNAVNYTVVVAEPDGTGVTVLLLERAP